MSIRDEVVEGDSTPIKLTIRHPQTEVLTDLTGTSVHEMAWKNKTTAAVGTVPMSIVVPPTDGVVSGKWDPLITITERNLLEIELHWKDGLGLNHTSGKRLIAFRKRL